MRFLRLVLLVIISLLPLLALAQSSVQRQMLALGNSDAQSVFTKNVGQWPDSILFRATASDATLWFMRDGIYYQFEQKVESARNIQKMGTSGFFSSGDSPTCFTSMIKAEFKGTNGSAAVGPEGELGIRHNYFLGDDKSKWFANVPNYSAIAYKGLFPGVDVLLRIENGELAVQTEFDRETVSKSFEIQYKGADSIEAGGDGKTYIHTKCGIKVFEGMRLVTQFPASSPRYQQVSTNVTGVSLVQSSFLGGTRSEGSVNIAIGPNGETYLAGSTGSADFPLVNPIQSSHFANYADIFVTKVAASGSEIIFSTYLGGRLEDNAAGIGVDQDGAIYLVGTTESHDFPTVSAFQQDMNGSDAFLVKISADGSTVGYSSYLGGSDHDFGTDIDVDVQSGVHLSGITYSSDLPLVNAFGTYVNSAVPINGFLVRASGEPLAIELVSYLGGSGDDAIGGVASDQMGNTYVVGFTYSTDFPVKNAYQETRGTYDNDAFVTKIDGQGDSIVYSTYLGGEFSEYGLDIDVDEAGSAYVTGLTTSPNFPSVNPIQPFKGPLSQSASDAFVTKLSPQGSSVVYSTCLGGNGRDVGGAIAVDRLGAAYVLGSTLASDFPLVSPYQASSSNPLANDLFVSKIAPNGSSLIYSTLLGGNDEESGGGLAVDLQGAAHLSGSTTSSDFPIINPLQGFKGIFPYSDAIFSTLGPFQDGDLDGVADNIDNCPFVINSDQRDNNGDGIGNACCCAGMRGNVDGLGEVDLLDLSMLIQNLTAPPTTEGGCPDEANVNGVGTKTDLSDLSLLIAFLTQTPQPKLPNCP